MRRAHEVGHCSDIGRENFGRVFRETRLLFMSMKVGGLRNQFSANAFALVNFNLNVNVKAMDFRHRKQELLERAKRVEEKAFYEKNAQAKDLMRALATLYRKMAEELEESRLFERHFLSLVFADQRLCPHAKALALND